MNINKVTDWLLKDWKVKVICLVISVFLYLFHQSALIDRKTFVIPLDVIEEGPVMHVGDVEKNVSVVVRATKEDMVNIHNSDLHATVNLNSIYENGTYELPVKIEFSDKIMMFDTLEIHIKPEKIKVHVEKKSSRYVPVEASIAGTVAYGYQIESIECNPSVALVYGPESMVNSISYINTEKIFVTNAERNFSTDANYLNYNKLVKIMETEPCKITISLSQLSSEKTFENLTIRPVNLSDDFELVMEYPAFSIKVGGTVNTLENYEISKSAIQVDLKNITEEGTYNLPVKVNLPSGIKLISASSDSVSVTLNKKHLEIEEEIPANETVTE